MRLYLDDVRPTPEGYDLSVKTAWGAIAWIMSGKITHVSLDNDLGDDVECGQGRDVANWIEHAAYDGRIPRMDIQIHSANPVARAAMEQAIAAANKWWRMAEIQDNLIT